MTVPELFSSRRRGHGGWNTGRTGQGGIGDPRCFQGAVCLHSYSGPCGDAKKEIYRGRITDARPEISEERNRRTRHTVRGRGHGVSDDGEPVGSSNLARKRYCRRQLGGKAGISHLSFPVQPPSSVNDFWLLGSSRSV